MSEKEELNRLRREKDRDIRFRAGGMRGFISCLFAAYLYSWLVPLDTVETRSLLILIALVAFAIGALTAHVGRFRVEYAPYYESKEKTPK